MALTFPFSSELLPSRYTCQGLPQTHNSVTLWSNSAQPLRRRPRFLNRRRWPSYFRAAPLFSVPSDCGFENLPSQVMNSTAGPLRPAVLRGCSDHGMTAPTWFEKPLSFPPDVTAVVT